MQYLSEEKITNKKVLLRCDFNVPVKDGVITDASKIMKSRETIDYLLKNNNKVILLSHFGRVKTEEDKEKNSLNIVYEYLKQYYDLEFIKDPLNLEEINDSNKQLFLVENTRFTDVPEKRESQNDLELAKYWASFADAFVIDAFASMHRAHSSTAGLSKYLDTYLGFLVETELKNLEPLVSVQEHPFVVVMGGAKVDDKIGIINELVKRCDKLILTGGILNTFLKVQGYNVGSSLVSTDEEIINNVKIILDKYADKISYTPEFTILRDNVNLEVNLTNIQDNDIIYDNLINKDLFIDAKLVFFNGTCGKFEEQEYSKGTKNLLDALKESSAKTYIGGGDTASSVKLLDNEKNFTYISSGGGATLEYVAYHNLKALEYIQENAKN